MTATYDAIATTTLGTATNTVTFSNISGSFTDLVLIAAGSTTSSGGNLLIRVGNGSVDTGSNYSATRIYGNGSTASSDRLLPEQKFYGSTGNFIDSVMVASLMNYSNTTTNKTGLFRLNTTTFVGANVQLWRSTSAINVIEFYTSANNFTVGTTFTLYGIKAE